MLPEPILSHLVSGISIHAFRIPDSRTGVKFIFPPDGLSQIRKIAAALDSREQVCYA